MAGYPDNNPKTAMGALKTPLDLVPPALTQGAARAFANGAKKYGPYNWREKQISSSVYYAAVLRHLHDWWDRIDSDDAAPDSGVHHLEHAVACIAMILDTKNSTLLNDNRPPRVNRDGNNTGSEGQTTSEDLSEIMSGLLAHARPERDGTASAGLPCVPAHHDHSRYGGETGGTVRGDRDEGEGEVLYTTPTGYRKLDP